MKNRIRFLSVLMALLLACAAGSAELSAPGVLPLSDKTIHFTVAWQNPPWWRTGTPMS